MLEEFNIVKEKTQPKTRRKTAPATDQDKNLSFDINNMFEAETWSTTLEDHRNNKTAPKNDSFSLDDLENDPKKINTKDPESFEDPKQVDEDVKETREDLANLVILLFDIGVNTSIKTFTNYEIKENETENSKKRKQLERVCVKIFDKYDFQPNIWTEFLAVLSVYGLQKYQSLEQQQQKTQVTTEQKKNVLDKIKNIGKPEQKKPTPDPAPDQKKAPESKKENLSIAELL